MTRLLIKWFVKNHQDVENPQVRAAYGRMAGFTGIVCNILLFILKLSAGLISGSVSVMADAFNNLSDTGSSIVTMVGLKMAGRPADPEHPFGHGRMEYMSGFIVSLIITLVGVELFKSSAEKIASPQELTVSAVTIVVLVCSIALKLWMCLFNRSLGKRIGSGALKATALDSLTDSAATAGVLVAVGVSALFGVNIDPYMGLIVAGFIIYTGLKTAKDTLDPLLGTAPDPELVECIQREVLAYEGFLGIHDLIVHNYGPGRLFVTLHVEVPHNTDILHCHEQIDLCERELGEKLSLELVIHMDPIITDDPAVVTAKAEMAASLARIDPALTLHDFRMVKGEQRSNLIFDVVIPPGFTMRHEALKANIAAAAREIDPSYCTVVNLDMDYTRVHE
ncbi:MAG: cation transporter [Clostridiales bacterium]|nr:cation transporter [Clostridiales bacterium]